MSCNSEHSVTRLAEHWSINANSGNQTHTLGKIVSQVGIEFEPPPEDGGSPSPLPASDFAAANSQIQALRRAAPGLVVSSAQARMIAAECFQVGRVAGGGFERRCPCSRPRAAGRVQPVALGRAIERRLIPCSTPPLWAGMHSEQQRFNPRQRRQSRLSAMPLLRQSNLSPLRPSYAPL
jgi:hypothetical protein